MFFDITSILAYVTGLILVVVFCRIFIKPIGKLFRFLLNGLIGGFILAAVNFAGGFAGITVTINPLTSLIAGFLGLPGVALVILLQYIL